MKHYKCQNLGFLGICNSKENELLGGTNGRYEKVERKILRTSAKWW